MKKNKQNELKKLPFFFSVNADKMVFDENGVPKEMQVLMTGKWNHPVYGPLVIDASDITQFKQNFDSGLRRDIPITEGHESFDEKPAVGWFKEIIDKGVDGLWAVMEWTEKGKTLLSDKAYKYFSPEFYTEYEDPETREIYENVLVGGALTNKPYFKKMQAVVLSEKGLNNYYIFNDMELSAIVAKKVDELSAEEIAFLKEHKGELTTEQLATFGSVLEEKKEETEEEKKAREEKEEADKVAAEKEAADKEAADKAAAEEAAKVEAEKVEASEKNQVVINASEYKALQDMANKGAAAFAELRESKVKSEATALVFSEQNSKGKVLPKHEPKLFSFMLGLTEAQRKVFTEIVSEIPSSKLFTEVGDSTAAEGTATAELEAKVKKAMSEEKGLQYADAVKKVLASEKGLAERYQAERVK